MKPSQPTRPALRQRECPSCHQCADFTYVGEQRWPAALARQYNVSPVMSLWICGNCRSTLGEPSLKKAAC